jgi:hypothetical protein
MMLKGEIARRQKDIDRARGSEIKLSSVFINGVEHEKIGLEGALRELRAIRKKARPVSLRKIRKVSI